MYTFAYFDFNFFIKLVEYIIIIIIIMENIHRTRVKVSFGSLSKFIHSMEMIEIETRWLMRVGRQTPNDGCRMESYPFRLTFSQSLLPSVSQFSPFALINIKYLFSSFRQ